MPKDRFQRQLETLVGEEDMEFIIPYPLLPPRFQKLSPGKNMLLRVSSETQMFVGWEGARLQPWMTLTPRAARQLLREVARKSVAYQQDMLCLADFLYENGTAPPDHPSLDDPSDRSTPEEAEIAPQPEESPDTLILIGMSQGGEPPLPPGEF